jgi:hypothetical protein
MCLHARHPLAFRTESFFGKILASAESLLTIKEQFGLDRYPASAETSSIFLYSVSELETKFSIDGSGLPRTIKDNYERDRASGKESKYDKLIGVIRIRVQTLLCG